MEDSKEFEKIELRSEEIQDILSLPPHFLVRSGIGILCTTLILFFIASFFFRYPDVVAGTAIITTEKPPAWLVARSSGKIKELYCRDKDFVTSKSLLAVIDNPANTSNVEKLKETLSKTVINDSLVDVSPFRALNHTSLELGDMQSLYSNLLRAMTDYDNYIFLNKIDQEKGSLLNQIAGRKKYSASLKMQVGTKKKDLDLASSIYNREKQLYDNGSLSKADLELAERSFLNAQESLQQLESAIISDDIELAQLEQTITKYDIQNLSDGNNYLSQLKTAYYELLSAIESWEQTYLLISSESGTVTFNNIWSENQFVQSGDNVFAIVSEHSGEAVGRVIVPAVGAGKIKVNQDVNFKLHNFPYMEYGILKGQVKNISLIPDKNNYAIEVILSNGLKTSSGKELPFFGELQGDGEIITDDLSLATRIISPLRSLLEKYTVN